MALFTIRSRRSNAPRPLAALTCSWCKAEVDELGPVGTFTMCANCVGWLDVSGTLAPLGSEATATGAAARPCTP